jgi:hypothetical protein
MSQVAKALDEIVSLLSLLPEEQRADIDRLVREHKDRKPWAPNPGPQTMAYYSPADLLYYGGSAGGGKSQLLLGLAVNEHITSRIFRRQFRDIDGTGGLAPSLKAILGTWDGYNASKHIWRLSAGGVPREIEFGAFENEKEASDYQGRPADLLGFDEAAQFQGGLVRFLMTWNRTTIKGQRTRTVLASNPPLTSEGLWLIDEFGPWLDPRHPHPAQPGELRWYTDVDNRSTEVGPDWIGEGPNGIVLRPKSRTFIPAALTDNPDLLDTDYGSTLANLPKALREAMLEGKFAASLEDADWQVIPTEWILAAQQRWEPGKLKALQGQMTDLGVDVAQGGKDTTALSPLYGVWFDEVVEVPGVNTRNGAAVASLIFTHQKHGARVKIDCTGGWGLGAYEHLQSNGADVIACVASQGSAKRSRDGKFGFVNKRAEYWWLFREALDPERGDGVALPLGRHVVAELTAARYKLVGRDQIQIEPKEDIIARLGRSTNVADAILLAWNEAYTGITGQRQSRLTEGKRLARRRSQNVYRQYGKVAGR